MGVTQLSKKLRDSKETPDEFAKSERLQGKTIGIDCSVVLHKSVGTNKGAGFFYLDKICHENNCATCPNNEVVDKCNRLCGWAKSNNITLKVSIDGKYHPMKEGKNGKRRADRESAHRELTNHLKSAVRVQALKKAAHVDESVLATAVEVFHSHGVEVIGAPYESDFQLVHWENIGFTDATYTTDSDIFAMGSNTMVDLLNFNSASGRCVILERSERIGRIMQGSSSWSLEDLILYASLSGCDFIPRLFRLTAKTIDDFMNKWKDPNRTASQDSMLTEFSNGKHWPAGTGKPGPEATDFVQKVKLCIGLLTHAPVTSLVDGEFRLVPLKPLPEGREWKDIIGFDPHTHFSGTSVED
ncbi:hypothetical protein ACHAWF_014516 [Thalassiosira exigua]